MPPVAHAVRLVHGKADQVASIIYHLLIALGVTHPRTSQRCDEEVSCPTVLRMEQLSTARCSYYKFEAWISI